MWPDGDVPQQLHLDLTVPRIEALENQHSRATALGARLLLDRSDDVQEPLRVYADPAGHPFCIFRSPRLTRPAACPQGDRPSTQGLDEWLAGMASAATGHSTVRVDVPA